MGPLDFVNHLLNMFVPALALAALAAALAKLVWRSELAAQAWWRLAAPAALVNAGVTLAGLALTGHDGKMVTYGALVVATTLTLWWRGFGPGRR